MHVVAHALQSDVQAPGWRGWLLLRCLRSTSGGILSPSYLSGGSLRGRCPSSQPLAPAREACAPHAENAQSEGIERSIEQLWSTDLSQRPAGPSWCAGAQSPGPSPGHWRHRLTWPLPRQPAAAQPPAATHSVLSPSPVQAAQHSGRPSCLKLGACELECIAWD